MIQDLLVFVGVGMKPAFQSMQFALGDQGFALKIAAITQEQRAEERPDPDRAFHRVAPVHVLERLRFGK